MSIRVFEPTPEPRSEADTQSDNVVKHLRVVAETNAREAEELLARAREDARTAQRLQRIAEQSADEARRLHQQAVRSLRSTEERFFTVLRSIGDGVIATDADGHVIFMNPVAERLTGWHQSDALGRKSSEVIRLLHPDTGAVLDDVVERTLRQSAILELEATALLRRPDGTTCMIGDSAAPVRDADGNLTGAVVVFRDVSERVRNEERLRLMSLAAEKALNGVVITGPDERIVYANPAMERISGFSADELTGQRPQDLLHGPATDTQAKRVLREAIEARQPVTVEIVNYGKQRVPYWVELHVAPSIDGGRVTHFVSMQVDITARRLAQEQLREADARKTEFIATVAHEMRNPLAPIRNAVQVMRMAGNDAAARERVRAIIERQLEHMVRLVDDLLDISRISRGKLELRNERIPIQSAINAALEVSRPIIKAAGHSLSIEVPREPIEVDADPMRLAQVFTNLLNNSAKYTDRGGCISLSVAREGEEAVVRVRDNGIGFPEEAVPRLFDAFAQAESAKARTQGGIGIGLSLVRSLVGLLGGSVEARSEGIDRGSEFIVRLPLPRDNISEVAGRPAAAPVAVGARRILVVDDDTDALDSLTLLLDLMGHEVRTAKDGPTAIDIAEQFHPEIVLLDIGMPGMSGYTVANRIRANAAMRNVLIVAVTSWGQEEDRRRSEEAGINRHLVKPVDFDELLRVLADYLGTAPPALRDESAAH
jgi:PAS domain S-box-containing protein